MKFSFYWDQWFHEVPSLHSIKGSFIHLYHIIKMFIKLRKKYITIQKFGVSIFFSKTVIQQGCGKLIKWDIEDLYG